MKNYLILIVFASAILTFTACSNKDKEAVDESSTEQTTTPGQTEKGTSVTIEAGEDGGKVEVETKEGTNVNVDIEKKEGSITVDDKGNKVDVKVKDGAKKD